MILGLDVGGANTKAASSDGRWTQTVYLPLWKKAPLGKVLGQMAEDADPRALGVVMTGELADCFPDKLAGVLYIKKMVEEAFTCPVRFWGAKGFRQSDPRDLAAANWSASAHLLSREVGDCIFVDMGSTTTDLIPIRAKPRAATADYRRLARGELVYSGLLRTNLAALLPSVRIDDQRIPLSSELFAITADAYRALGEITEAGYRCDPPDGAGKDRRSALRRLARTVCADLEEIGEKGALAIATQAMETQHDTLIAALAHQAERYDLDTVAAAGVGEDVIERAARRLGLRCIRLSDRYGLAVSEVFPAYAVARLAETDI